MKTRCSAVVLSVLILGLGRDGLAADPAPRAGEDTLEQRTERWSRAVAEREAAESEAEQARKRALEALKGAKVLLAELNAAKRRLEQLEAKQP